jgi:futalosine hydrolase
VNILIVIPTRFEARFLLDGFDGSKEELVRPFSFLKHTIHPFICGTGPVACAASTAAILQNQHFDLVINAGIAGSYLLDLAPGSLVHITSECLPEFGEMNPKKCIFTPIHQMSFDASLPDFYSSETLVNPFAENYELPESIIKVKGATVIGLDYSRNFYKSTAASVETMEGAAFFFACLLSSVPFLQLRAISNYTGIKGKTAWEAESALNKLATALHAFISNLTNE